MWYSLYKIFNCEESYKIHCIQYSINLFQLLIQRLLNLACEWVKGCNSSISTIMYQEGSYRTVVG